jgi:hypothetical protein
VLLLHLNCLYRRFVPPSFYDRLGAVATSAGVVSALHLIHPVRDTATQQPGTGLSPNRVLLSIPNPNTSRSSGNNHRLIATLHATEAPKQAQNLPYHRHRASSFFPLSDPPIPLPRRTAASGPRLVSSHVPFPNRTFRTCPADGPGPAMQGCPRVRSYRYDIRHLPMHSLSDHRPSSSMGMGHAAEPEMVRRRRPRHQ